MADKYEKLAGELNRFQRLLELENAEELYVEDSNKEPNHTELIDFDQLKTVLAEAARLCQTQAESERELEVVKAWLTGRVNSYRRAYRVTSQSGEALAEIEPGLFSVTSLIEKFENEGRRLRRSTSLGDSHLLQTKQRKQPDYRQFKS